MFSIVTFGWVIFIVNVDIDDNDFDDADVDDKDVDNADAVDDNDFDNADVDDKDVDNADVDDKDVDNGKLCVWSTSINILDIWNEFQLLIWKSTFTRTEYLT